MTKACFYDTSLPLLDLVSGEMNDFIYVREYCQKKFSAKKSYVPENW